MSEQNKAVVRRFINEVMNKGNMSVLDELLAPNYVYHGPGGQEVRGIEGAKDMIGMYRSAFPDMKSTVDDMIAEGDKVVTRWSATGTHKGDLMGIAHTGKKVKMTGMVINRLVKGKVVEDWEEFDQLGMMQQLGVAPTEKRQH